MTHAHREYPNAAVDGAGRGSKWIGWIGYELNRREAETLLQIDKNDASLGSNNDR